MVPGRRSPRMPQPANQPDKPETPSAEGPAGIQITRWYRRLARYQYLDDLIRGRRVLEIGGGDGRGAAFLRERGAAQVLGLDPDPGALEGLPGLLGEGQVDLILWA